MKSPLKLGILCFLLLVTSYLQSQKYHLTYSDTLMLIGEQMYKEKDLMGAIMNLDSCIQLNPLNDQCRFTRGKIAYDMGNFPLAEVLFKSVLALTERDAVSWNMLGLCFQELKHYDSAEFCFKNAVKINPDESKFFANWGKNEYLRGNLAHAENLYNTAVFLNPKYIPHLKNRAEVKAKMGKKEEALADLKQASEANPKDKELLNKINSLENGHISIWIWFVLGFVLIATILYWRRKPKNETT